MKDLGSVNKDKDVTQLENSLELVYNECEFIPNNSPKLMESFDIDKVNKEVAMQTREREKDEKMNDNIANVAKEGNLSPRHMEDLRSMAKKYHNIISLQVKTRVARIGGHYSQYR